MLHPITRRKVIKNGALALTALSLPIPLISFKRYNPMKDKNTFEVIIIGGSYAGLSAAMTLGRALRKVLIIDNGKPCNRNTPHSHNFLTQDGKTPSEIAALGRTQVEAYRTVSFYEGLATKGKKTDYGFEITTFNNDTFKAKKLIFATGVKDLMPKIDGFAACWGKSVIHCPYCHGYEVKHEKTGILANGDIAFHYAQLISNWTNDLTIFTNGDSTLTSEQMTKIKEHNIKVVEKEVTALQHNNGNLESIILKDQSTFPLKAIYARPEFEQHCNIPEKLGCEPTEQGHLKVDLFQKTTIPGIYAPGDASSPLRSVSYAVAMGNFAGAAVNNEMIEEEF